MHTHTNTHEHKAKQNFLLQEAITAPKHPDKAPNLLPSIKISYTTSQNSHPHTLTLKVTSRTFFFGNIVVTTSIIKLTIAGEILIVAQSASIINDLFLASSFVHTSNSMLTLAGKNIWMDKCYQHVIQH